MLRHLWQGASKRDTQRGIHLPLHGFFVWARCLANNCVYSGLCSSIYNEERKKERHTERVCVCVGGGGGIGFWRSVCYLLDEAHSGSNEDSNVATGLANAVCNGLKQHGGNERFASSCFQVHNCVLLFCLLQHFQLITTKVQAKDWIFSEDWIFLQFAEEKMGLWELALGTCGEPTTHSRFPSSEASGQNLGSISSSPPWLLLLLLLRSHPPTFSSVLDH